MSEDDRVDGAVQLAQDAIQRVAALESEVEEMRLEMAELRRENERLRDQRELIQRVQQAAAMKPDKRAAVLIKTLHNDATAHREAGKKPIAKMDTQDARTALGRDINRTLAWEAMQKAVELVEDATDGSDLLQYVKRDRSAPENSHLRLDLREDDMPATVGGFDITGHTTGGSVTGD